MSYTAKNKKTTRYNTFTTVKKSTGKTIGTNIKRCRIMLSTLNKKNVFRF
jgi:hypothetical protein